MVTSFHEKCGSQRVKAVMVRNAVDDRLVIEPHPATSQSQVEQPAVSRGRMPSCLIKMRHFEQNASFLDDGS
jgi:hypothetical protein